MPAGSPLESAHPPGLGEPHEEMDSADRPRPARLAVHGQPVLAEPFLPLKASSDERRGRYRRTDHRPDAAGGKHHTRQPCSRCSLRWPQVLLANDLLRRGQGVSAQLSGDEDGWGRRWDSLRGAVVQDVTVRSGNRAVGAEGEVVEKQWESNSFFAVVVDGIF